MSSVTCCPCTTTASAPRRPPPWWEEHLKDCDACQEEFHKLQANLLPLPLPVPGKEEQKAEGLAKVKKGPAEKAGDRGGHCGGCDHCPVLRRLPVFTPSHYGGTHRVRPLCLRRGGDRPPGGRPPTRLWGLGRLPLAAEEDDETGGTIVVLNSIYCLADPLTHFLQGTLSWRGAGL